MTSKGLACSSMVKQLPSIHEGLCSIARARGREALVLGHPVDTWDAHTPELPLGCPTANLSSLISPSHSRERRPQKQEQSFILFMHTVSMLFIKHKIKLPSVKPQSAHFLFTGKK